MTMPNIVVLGTGMAGFGAAYRLHAEGIAPVMYDKNGYHGGHTASFRYETGFLFDVGPHISFTKDPRIQELFADSVEQRYETVQINLNNYWKGYWPPHPVQLHMRGLPEELIIKAIADFVAARQLPEESPQNYADWLLASFGVTFAEEFPMRYTRKYHTTSAENMSTDWLGPRIYRPSLEEVLRGAISPSAPQVHYITHFRYPSDGGFMCYLKKFVPMGNLKASRRLACSTCTLVNIGVDREDLSSAHMTYFYDEDICFTRLGFPHMLSKRNVPPGAGSIQAEVYFSDKYKPISGSAEDWIEPVIRDLRRCGLLRDDDRILSRKAMFLRYANVIFDVERAAALKTVHGYLEDLGIAYCGRYGDWGYMWTDESFKSGELAAERALSATTSISG